MKGLIRRYSIILLALVLVAGMISCGEDEEKSNPLVATWYIIQVNGTNVIPANHYYFKFNDTMLFETFIYDEATSGECRETGLYSYNETQVTVTFQTSTCTNPSTGTDTATYTISGNYLSVYAGSDFYLMMK